MNILLYIFVFLLPTLLLFWVHAVEWEGHFAAWNWHNLNTANYLALAVLVAYMATMAIQGYADLSGESWPWWRESRVLFLLYFLPALSFAVAIFPRAAHELATKILMDGETIGPHLIAAVAWFYILFACASLWLDLLR